MTIADDLQRIQQLHDSGSLNDAEFALAKTKLLNGTHDLQTEWSPIADIDVGPEKDDRETRKWAFILHMSVLGGFALPPAGFIAPIVIWQLKKNELPGIDAHGKNAVNWIISAAIYMVVSVLLVLVIIGIPMIVALGAVGIVFPIIAAIKANHGEVWKYPLSISFV